MADTNAKRSPIVEKILKGPGTPRLEPEAEDARESFQEARARSRESVMLDVRLTDGTVESFPCAYLTRVRYLPGDRLIVRFGSDEVSAEGGRTPRSAADAHIGPFNSLTQLISNSRSGSGGTRADRGSAPQMTYETRSLIKRGHWITNLPKGAAERKQNHRRQDRRRHKFGVLAKRFSQKYTEKQSSDQNRR